MFQLSDQMATSIGYYNKTGFPNKHLRESICAICGDSTETKTLKKSSILSTLFSYMQFQGKKLQSNKSIQLECKHSYHEPCIRLDSIGVTLM